MRDARRLTLSELHWPFLFGVAAIVTLGCYNLHSAASHHAPALWLAQAKWFGIGLLIALATLKGDYRITEGLAYILYSIVCVMLLAVLLVGKSAMGARRWLVLGPVTFQPSEIAKVAIIFCMARYFSTRIVPGGYSIKALARPLNPTRPLACLVWVLLKWHKPWLVDPVGELARRIHLKLGDSVPVLEDLWWFRVTLFGAIVVASVALVVGVVRAERASSILHPWPDSRRRRLLLAIAASTVVAFCVLAYGWHAPAVADPFGNLLQALNQSAQPGGSREVLVPSLSLRPLLLFACAIYLGVSLVASYRGKRAVLDLVCAPIDLLAVPALTVLVQPDLGTSGIIFFIGMTIILVVGVRLHSLLLMGVLGGLTSFIAWFGILKDYQKRRILTFIDPEQDLKGAGWNAVQSLIAVGSGRWTGKGHRNGTQTQLSFLPEQHTDFAFSVWAEEQGFLGCLLLLGLYFCVLSFALRIASEARETYGMLLATGLAALIMWQVIVNVGMVIGVLPVVGITLPLFSYGGSSVLTVMLCVGLLLNVHWRRRA